MVVHLEPSCPGTGEHEFSWGSIDESTLEPSFLIELGCNILQLAAKHCENEKKPVLPSFENTKINCKGEVCYVEWEPYRMIRFNKPKPKDALQATFAAV